MIKYFNKLFSSQRRFHNLILRRVHNDLKVPDFDYYRRNSSKDPTKPRDKRENDAIKSKMGTYLAFAGLYLGTLYGTKTIIEESVLIMAPSADVLAMATIEVDLTSIPEGVNSTFKWRNKPLFILHRTPEDIEREKSVSIATLRDPAHDQDRCENPEWLIVIGVCTHLGCVPIAHAGDFGGYYCPCHGSHFDASGRIRKGPAPTNLEIPPHKFLEDGKLIVG